MCLANAVVLRLFFACCLCHRKCCFESNCWWCSEKGRHATCSGKLSRMLAFEGFEIWPPTPFGCCWSLPVMLFDWATSLKEKLPDYIRIACFLVKLEHFVTKFVTMLMSGVNELLATLLRYARVAAFVVVILYCHHWFLVLLFFLSLFWFFSWLGPGLLLCFIFHRYRCPHKRPFLRNLWPHTVYLSHKSLPCPCSCLHAVDGRAR